MAALLPDNQQMHGLGSKLKKAVKKVAKTVETITKAVVVPTKSNIKAAGVAAVEAKKDLKLNKLGTRKAVKAVHKAQFAIATMDKNKLKEAALTAANSPAALMVITAAGNAVAPGSGAAMAAGLQQVAAKEQAKQLEREVNAAVDAYVASQPTDLLPAAPVATPATTPAAPAWPRYLLWGSVGLLATGLLLRRRQQTTMETH